jgi:mannose-6-phosphate isomerase-like protein (cupin superfamily)
MQRTIYNPLYKDTVTFLRTSREAEGKYSLHELSLMPGGGNPAHYHTAFAETFTAVKGQLGLSLRRKRILLEPGESYTVAKGEVHNFFNPGREEIVFTVKFTPGHEGMENTLRIGYGLAADGLTNKKGVPKNLMVAALIMDMADSYPAGAFSLLRPLLSFLARRAKRKGIDIALMARYCRPF